MDFEVINQFCGPVGPAPGAGHQPFGISNVLSPLSSLYISPKTPPRSRWKSTPAGKSIKVANFAEPPSAGARRCKCGLASRKLSANSVAPAALASHLAWLSVRGEPIKSESLQLKVD